MRQHGIVEVFSQHRVAGEGHKLVDGAVRDSLPRHASHRRLDVGRALEDRGDDVWLNFPQYLALSGTTSSGDQAPPRRCRFEEDLVTVDVLLSIGWIPTGRREGDGLPVCTNH
ncbi:hypothetical protein ASC55_02410 [Microbacterium sp. Root322]|nr:hypothetical protein ASC55_02410 [Microbacterium sp. Root322]